MVLMAIVGNLGAGKTLALTYLAWRNKRKGLKVYSNYALSFPYTPVNNVNDVLSMQDGFFAGDELWHWLDSRASMSKRNQVIGNFLLTSRKKGVNFAFTAQTVAWQELSFGQIDVRIRKVCDFLALPQLNVQETVCRLIIFSYPSLSPIRTYKFKTQPIFDMYDTNEVIDSLPDENEQTDFDEEDDDEEPEEELRTPWLATRTDYHRQGIRAR